MSPETRLAIQAYHNVIRRESSLKRTEDTLNKAVRAVPMEDMEEYVKLTAKLKKSED